MRGFWITFADGSNGYCEGESAYDAVRIAEKLSGKTVKLPEGGDKYKPDLPSLPYPATPIIWQFEHPISGKCPAFCYAPNQCKGSSSCPQNRSCTE